MTEFKGCKNYTVIAKERLDDINATAFTLRHNKTKARVVCLQNSDDNKAFMIGFKTPNNKGTGVAHILEHTVLCGSDKFPVKDAMTEVSKGSVNTFLNAFTYPDRTLYPVASCNNKDFQNLMEVYLDAVFNPRVLKEKKIFMQEGWHYEPNEENNGLIVNGVVYNEMKGVYSSPDSMLSSYTMFSLFPDTQYGVESGGNPEEIIDLTYEDFCGFYKKLYHPSNSRIYLYGNMDFEEKLKYIDEEYLSHFEEADIDSEVKMQAPFAKRKRIEKEYSLADTDDEKDATYLSYNVVCSDYTDVKTTEVMDAINYALCSVPGSKLKKRLIDAGIGKDVYSELGTDICQKVFSIIAQNANPEDEDKFVEIIESTMKEIVKEGFDEKALEAAISISDFTYREADFGLYPKGVSYGSMIFEKWLYTDDDIFTNLKQNAIRKELRESIKSGLFEQVLRTRILENKHKTILVMKPKKGLSKEKDELLNKKLSKFYDSLSEAEKKAIIKESKALKKYQDEEDSKDALATIPSLTIKDIDKKINRCVYKVESINGVKSIYTEAEPNGIAYFTLGFDASRIPKRLLPALSILKSQLGLMDTDSYTYGELVNETYIKTGMIYYNTMIYKDVSKPNDYTVNFEVKSRTLYEFLPDAFKLIEEVLFSSKLDDKKRLKENLEQSKVRIQGFFLQAGHTVAAGRALSSISDSSALMDVLSGMGYYRCIEDTLANFDEASDKLIKDMKEVLSLLITKDNLEIGYGADHKNKKAFCKAVGDFIDKLPDSSKATKPVHMKAVKGSEAFTCASMVNYAAVSGNFVAKSGLEYDGSLLVSSKILNNEYLWNEVRLKGGAYGCFCSFRSNGEAVLASYRDPNLKKTFKVFSKVSDFLKKYDGSKEDVDRYIISTIGDMDVPLTASMKVARSYIFYKTNTTNAIKQKERNEILSTTKEVINASHKYVDALYKNKAYSCVGSEEKLSSEGKMFNVITPLFKS
jgi:Zn-dependent M16 (insulinase) family peptidase